MPQEPEFKDSLRSLQLSGWKSIKKMEPPLEFRQLNILIGANGAGKSNLVSYFRMLNAMVDKRLQEFIGRAGGADALLHLGASTTREVEATLEFSSKDGANRYYQRLVFAAVDTLIFSEECLSFKRRDFKNWRPPEVLGSGHRESLIDQAAEAEGQEAKGPHAAGKAKKRIASVTRHLLRECRVLHFHDTSETAKVRQGCSIDANRRLEADAANLAAMLFRYERRQPASYRLIVETIRLMVPFFDDFILQPNDLNPRQIVLRWRARGSDYEFGPHQLSDGTLRAMALTTLLLQPREDMPDLIILDEPELGQHPASLNLLAVLLKSASAHCQILAATQSPTLLNEFEPEDVIVVDRQGQDSTFRRHHRAELKQWLTRYSLGEIWEKNLIGGGPGNA